MQFNQRISNVNERLTNSLKILNEKLEKSKNEQFNLTAELENRLIARMLKAEEKIESLELAQQSHDKPAEWILNTWRNASLANRIRFISDLLAEDHPLQDQLKKIKGLEELRIRGNEMASWINIYPELFAESAYGVLVSSPAKEICEVNGDLAELAYETIEETRRVFADYFKNLSLEWIIPSPGDKVTLEYENVGEEESNLKSGHVASLIRPGFRLKGRMKLPARIHVSIPIKDSLPPQKPIKDKPLIPDEANTKPSTLTPDLWPEWRKKLLQKGMGMESSSINKWLEILDRLVQPQNMVDNEEILEVLSPLLPILKTPPSWGDDAPQEEWRNAFLEIRDELVQWMNNELKIELLRPKMDDLFQEDTMKALSERRALQPDADNKVARVEMIGVRHRGQVIHKAEVMRYKYNKE
jgi:molecular chaperone GrpE (heat shock protein)